MEEAPHHGAENGGGGGCLLKHEEYAHWVVHYELEPRRLTRNKHVGRDSVIGTSRGSNPSGGEIFRTRPDRYSLLYNRYRVYLPAVKRPGCSANHTLPSSAEVRERVQLHLYSPLWAFMACYRVNSTYFFYIYELTLLQWHLTESAAEIMR